MVGSDLPVSHVHPHRLRRQLHIQQTVVECIDFFGYVSLPEQKLYEGWEDKA